MFSPCRRVGQMWADVFMRDSAPASPALPPARFQLGPPASARLPKTRNNDREIEAPRKEPNDMERPIKDGGKLVVIVGIALAQKAKYVFVDEVKIEKSVNISRRRNVAVGMALVGIAQSGKDVPRSRNRQEE